MLPQNLVVFDFETGSDDKNTTEITQIGAVAINPRTLRPFPGTDSTFNSLMRPSDAYDPDIITDDALRITKQNRDVLAAAPEAEEVWHKFAKWVARWGMNGKNDFYCAPIPAGHNILNFDLPIYDRYCFKYKTLSKDSKGRLEPGMFNGYIRYDTMQLLASWFESLREPAKLNLDYLRDYFGMGDESKANAHDALQDVIDTSMILGKVLEMNRLIMPNVKFKDCFKTPPVSLDKKKASIKKLVSGTLSEGGNGQ